MKIHTKILNKALSELKPIIQKRSVPVIECVKIDSQGLTGTDLERDMFVPLVTGLSEPIILNYAELINVIKGMSGILELKVNSDSLEICSGNGTVKLSLRKDDFPISPELGKCEAKFICPKLSGMVKYAGNDDLKPNMKGVYLNQGEMAGTDAHILKKEKSSDLLIPGLSAIIPSNVAKLVNEKVNAIWYKENNLMKFNFPNRTELIFKLIDQKFPDYNSVIPEINKDTKILRIKRDEMINALNQIIPALNKTIPKVKLTLNENDSEFYGEDIDFATEAKTNVHCQWDGESNFQICFNQKYMMQILQDCDTEMIELEITTANRCMIIRTENEIRLIMPLQIN